MARPTEAQRRQRSQAWLLYQLGGSIGNLSPLLYRGNFPPAIESRLRVAIQKLEEVRGYTRHALAASARLRQASLRRTTKPQKESL